MAAVSQDCEIVTTSDVVVRTRLALTLRGHFVDGIPFAFTDGYNNHDNFTVSDFVNESIADASQLDLVSVFVSSQLGREHT